MDEEFLAKCQERMAMSMDERIRLGFVPREPKPWRENMPSSFETMYEYRKWCHENIPREYGFRVIDPPPDWKQFDDEDDEYEIIST